MLDAIDDLALEIDVGAFGHIRDCRRTLNGSLADGKDPQIRNADGHGGGRAVRMHHGRLDADATANITIMLEIQTGEKRRPTAATAKRTCGDGCAVGIDHCDGDLRDLASDDSRRKPRHFDGKGTRRIRRHRHHGKRKAALCLNTQIDSHKNTFLFRRAPRRTIPENSLPRKP